MKVANQLPPGPTTSDSDAMPTTEQVNSANSEGRRTRKARDIGQWEPLLFIIYLMANRHRSRTACTATFRFVLPLSVDWLVLFTGCLDLPIN